MKKTADELWNEFLTMPIVGSGNIIRKAVEASARETAREEIEDAKETFGDLVLGIVRKRLQIDPPAPSEDPTRKHRLAPVGTWKARCERCGREGPDDSEWWRQFECTPSEGEEGEVEPLAYRKRLSGGGHQYWDAKRFGRRPENDPGVWEPLYSHETVQRLQRERDEAQEAVKYWAKLYNETYQKVLDLSTKLASRLEESNGLRNRATGLHHENNQLKAEIARLQRQKDEALRGLNDTKEAHLSDVRELRAQVAHLSDPENWEVEWDHRQFGKATPTVRYIGPPESEGESDG